MQKKYIVRLTDEERNTLYGVIKKLQGSSQQVRRAHILLKADADSSSWTDQDIAEAFLCRRKTVENIRQRLVTGGFARTLYGEKPLIPPHQKRLDGDKKRRSSRYGWASPHKGSPIGPGGCWPSRSSNWSSSTRSAMRPYARCPKKRHDVTQDAVLGDPACRQWRICRVHGKRLRDLRATL